MITCTGFPKSGTHMLGKTMELIGVPLVFTEVPGKDFAIIGHYPFSGKRPDGKCIHIIRNPKNVLVSWVRMGRKNVAPGYLVSAIHNNFNNESLYDGMMGYAEFLDDPETLNVRFEDVIADKEDQRIADFVGVEILPGVSEHRLGGTKTWTGKLSVWEDFWFPRLEEEWIKGKGPELESVFGYG